MPRRRRAGQQRRPPRPYVGGRTGRLEPGERRDEASCRGQIDDSVGRKAALAVTWLPKTARNAI